MTRKTCVFAFLFFVMTGLFYPSAHSFQLSIIDRVVTAPGDSTVLNGLADSLESQFNSTLASIGSQRDFLKEVGNSNALSGRPLLSPGANLADRGFLFSYGASGALSLGEGTSLSQGITTPSNQLPPIGLGAKAGFTLGISAKKLPKILPLDPSRVMFIAAFSSMDLSSWIGRGISVESFQSSLAMSYQYYLPQQWTPLIRFNGFKVTSGLSYSNLDVRYSTPFQLSEQSGPTTMNWSGTVDLSIDSRVWSLTNEVSTGFRLFWIWNLYTGVGVDLNAGSSEMTGSSNGPVTAPFFTGTAVVSGDPESAAPSWIQARAFLGTGVDLGPLGVFAQGTISTPSAYGLNFGASLAL